MHARQERMLRAGLSATVSTAATAVAHLLGGGLLPPPMLLGLVFVVSILACFGLGGRRVTLPHLALSIGASQLLLHAAFTIAEPAAGHAPVVAPGHLHTAGMLMPGVVAPVHTDGMVWAHAVAGLITIASLRVGTAAVRSLARTVALPLTVVLALAVVATPALPQRPRGAVRAQVAPRRSTSLLLAATRDLRGPPVLATI